jgi:hypothetical protein
MERLFRLTARKYADSGGKCADSAGAEESVGAEGGNHVPVPYIV